MPPKISPQTQFGRTTFQLPEKALNTRCKWHTADKHSHFSCSKTKNHIEKKLNIVMLPEKHRSVEIKK